MPNWKQIAQAREWTIPADEMERLSGVLDSLEAAFAPLRTLAPHESEPVTSYRLAVPREEVR